jgi:hypothetical protein
MFIIILAALMEFIAATIREEFSRQASASTVPTTVPSSLQSPAIAEHHIGLPTAVEMSESSERYETKSKLKKDYYFTELLKHFNTLTENTNSYQLIKGKHSISVKCAETLLYRCPRENCFVRNLYLEVHSCHYCMSEWWEKHSANFFGTWDVDKYKAIHTPEEVGR